MQTHTHTHFHPMVHIHMLAPSPFIGSVFRGTSSQSGRLDIFRSNNLSQTLRVALVSPSALRTRWLVQGGLPVWPRRQTLYTNTQLRLKEFLLRYIFVHHTPWLLLLPHPVKKNQIDTFDHPANELQGTFLYLHPDFFFFKKPWNITWRVGWWLGGGKHEKWQRQRIEMNGRGRGGARCLEKAEGRRRAVSWRGCVCVCVWWK